MEQIGNSLTFLAFFVESKVGKTGLTVTVDTYKNGSSLATGQSATAVGGGLYSYTLSSGSVDAEGLYAAIFKTSTTSVDQQHIPSLWLVGKGGIENLDAAVSSRTTGSLSNLDAAVSSRATPAQVTTIVAAVAGGGGSVTHTETITDLDENPLDGVSVIVRATNNPSASVAATGTTNAFGEVTFQLDPGTYYLWCQRAGINFANPFTVEVTP